MKKVKLVFPDVFLLWQFKREINVSSMEADFKSRALICECTQEQVELAQKKYKAKLLNAQEVF